MADRGAALVTGAGARLGKFMAEALGEDGWDIAVHYSNSADGANETAANITGMSQNAVTVQADLSDEEQTAGLLTKASEALNQPIILLINSASAFQDDNARHHTREKWDLHMDVNLRAPITLAQSMVNGLPKDAKGLVINLIDQRVWKLNPQFFTYTLSKSALWSATRTMAQAFAPNVRVNGIGPGPTLRSVHQSAEEFAAEAEATLTGEGSSPAEIVAAMRYLISATSVTGQMIASDGGQHLLWQTPDIDG